MNDMNDFKSSSRKILHVDLDAFFASVEELDHPEYKGKPLAVGGSSRRGILTTANYEARKYGLHSAMPVFQALRLCPDLILLPVRHGRYSEKSAEVFRILRSYTRIIEKVSIDEAYLDLTKRPEPSRFLADEIRKEIREKTGLTASVGISYNKFLAKLASDWNKPDGVFEIRPEDVPDILVDIPVKRVHGIGSAGAEKLKALGVATVGDLLLFKPAELVALFGKHGEQIWEYIRGRDMRPVSSGSRQKSIGVERTYSKDITDRDELLNHISEYSAELEKELGKIRCQAKTITLKLKSADFKTITRSHTLESPISEASDIEEVARFLFFAEGKLPPIRLLGITASQLTEDSLHQLHFL